MFQLFKFKVEPIDDIALHQGIWKYLPVRVEGLCTRTWIMAFFFTFVWGGSTLLIFGVTCSLGEDFFVWEGLFL